MATWRLAKSLAALRSEVNAVAPERSKTHDGTIGDAAHANRASRHNPNNSGVVCAMDITHDPAHGMDTYELFNLLRLNPHPCLEYVISNRRVASRTSHWAVRAYGGSSPHDKHIHIAVGRGPDSEPTPPYDDMTPWGVAPKPTPGENEMTEEQDRLLRELKVSSVAQSFFLDFLIAAIDGDMGNIGAVVEKRDAAVAAKRKELGLDK